MGSKDETISEFELEFSEEEVLEAIKKKEGRPSNRTREIRDRLHEAKRLTDILGILDSGILTKLTDGFTKGFAGISSEGTIPVDKRPEVSEGFTADLLKRSGLVNDKFLETNKDILALSDDVVSNALITYLPPIVAVGIGLGGLWIAEGQIKEVPPILHTMVLNIKLLTPIFSGLGLLLKASTDFLNDFIQIIPDIQKEVDGIIQDVQDKAERTVEDPFGTGQKFVQSEIAKIQKLIERALKGDIFAILELSLLVGPVTLALILAGDFVIGDF